MIERNGFKRKKRKKIGREERGSKWGEKVERFRCRNARLNKKIRRESKERGISEEKKHRLRRGRRYW